MKLLCRIFGHDLDPLFTQPDPHFEKIWNELLGGAMWYEMFDHECQRCGTTIRVWRWTRPAAAKMVHDDS